MGATSAQGWYLFMFIVGFTLGPAGLVALGLPVALLGFLLMAGALGGFLTIKERGTSQSTDSQVSSAIAHAASQHEGGR